MISEEKSLIYTVAKAVPTDKHYVQFTIEIIDEHTLQVLEKKYRGKLQFDGGRVFTLTIDVPILGMMERDPTMWEKMVRDQPEIVQAFVLARLKGEV